MHFSTQSLRGRLKNLIVLMLGLLSALLETPCRELLMGGARLVDPESNRLLLLLVLLGTETTVWTVAWLSCDRSKARMTRYRIVKDDGLNDAIAGQSFSSYDKAHLVLERYYSDLCCSCDQRECYHIVDESS